MIRLGPQVCGTIEESARREWLVADGLGGYAMGTVAGLRTRRYHGLLVVAVGGPSARMLGSRGARPVLVVGDVRHRLATDEWGYGAVDPAGTGTSSRSSSTTASRAGAGSSVTSCSSASWR